MPNGTMKWFDGAKGFGFIQPEDGSKDVFVHINDARRSGIDDLREGQRLSYELQEDDRGKTSAIGIKAL
jgi:CspA family cold shock protein